LLLPRTLSAVILAPFFLYLVYAGYPYFHVLVGAIAAVMAWEFGCMDAAQGPQRRAFLVSAAVASVAAATLAGTPTGLAVAVTTAAAAVVAETVAGRRTPEPAHLAIPYVAIPAVLLLFVHAAGARETVFWLLAVVWGTDIGAYAFGRLIGGPKLAPKISPKKTWAGATGGLICGVAAAAGLVFALNLPLSGAMLGVAALTSVATQSGDLLESALKRWYDVKDSGTLIPGHGGVMDRFDGLWAAAPVAALFCVVFNGGVYRW
jgi:phosphatidate cytidylyltransferase